MGLIKFLKEKFSRKKKEEVNTEEVVSENISNDVETEKYYVNMMQAWYFATALAKQWDTAVRYLQENRLCQWVHNKTIQKAVESYRITEEQKTYLKTLKRK